MNENFFSDFLNKMILIPKLEFYILFTEEKKNNSYNNFVMNCINKLDGLYKDFYSNTCRRH